METSKLVKTAFINLTSAEALTKTPSVLMGVSEETEKVFKKLDIHTVFDLATSRLFSNASLLTESSKNHKSLLRRFGHVPSDMINAEKLENSDLENILLEAISVLDGIGPDLAKEMEKVFQVHSIRELALFQPYQAALNILNDAFFPENNKNYDPEAPEELLPKMGDFPTERVQYSTLVMDKIADRENGTPRQSLTSKEFSPISLDDIAAPSFKGFDKIATGALLTFDQSWYVEGLTLGSLLHSTALAPGESTRVAVIDWVRKERGEQVEITTEKEALVNDTSHNRSISEVTEAVAREAQEGFSKSKVWSSSKQGGISAGATLGALGLGGNASASSSQSGAESYSTSTGSREMSANMSQNINDRTHQHAHSTRSRRASVVKEVSQSEQEKISTRVVTNYNHMHALTVQYYEVVQLYRVEVTFKEAQRCVFIPFSLLDFSKEDVINKFEDILMSVALNGNIKQAIRSRNQVELSFANSGTQFVNKDNNLVEIDKGKLDIDEVRVRTKQLNTSPAPEDNKDNAQIKAFTERRALFSEISSDIIPIEMASMIGRGYIHANFKSSSIFLPKEAIIIGFTNSNSGANTVLHTSSGSVSGNSNMISIPITELKSIEVAQTRSLDLHDGDNVAKSTVTLALNIFGDIINVPLPKIKLGEQDEKITVVTVKNAPLNKDLIKHFEQNKYYYSQAIFRNLDASQIAFLLSNYTFKVNEKEKPLPEIIDPKPIAHIGNYLVFGVNANPQDDQEWFEWLHNHGFADGKTKEEYQKRLVTKHDLVPISSGGVFAEAVLGRFNGAEKLDITRFWNWQDSPIPIQPTEIAAIQSGSRSQAMDLKGAQLSNPTIHITNPTNLPDPTGMTAILQAIQNGNTFRDISGLSNTIKLAGDAMDLANRSATAAGQQSGTNLANAFQHDIELKKIEAMERLAKSQNGNQGGGSKNVTEQGSKINYFDKFRGQESGNGENSAGNPTSGGVLGGNNGAADNSSGAASNPATENPAFQHAVWGANGDSIKGMLDKAISNSNNNAHPKVNQNPNCNITKGLSFALASKLKAKDIYDMIMKSTKIEIAHKNIFCVNSSGILCVKSTPSSPVWLNNLALALNDDKWHFTTADTSVPDGTSAASQLTPDCDGNDQPGHRTNTSIQTIQKNKTTSTINIHKWQLVLLNIAESGLVIRGKTFPCENTILKNNIKLDSLMIDPNDLKVVKLINKNSRWEPETDKNGNQILVPDPNDPSKDLIIKDSKDKTMFSSITNRGDRGLIVVAITIQQKSRKDDEIIQTLFHELACHGGRISQGLTSEHEFLKDKNGNLMKDTKGEDIKDPMGEVNEIEKAVDDYFDKIKEEKTKINMEDILST
ncbi:MAG: hypothetical protein ACKV1O_20350 [Saprospiraceae bacterium]